MKKPRIVEPRRPPCFTDRQWAYWVDATKVYGTTNSKSIEAACGDCTHEHQQRMIRAFKCDRPCLILPGHPLHKRTANERLPEGVQE